SLPARRRPPRRQTTVSLKERPQIGPAMAGMSRRPIVRVMANIMRRAMVRAIAIHRGMATTAVLRQATAAGPSTTGRLEATVASDELGARRDSLRSAA